MRNHRPTQTRPDGAGSNGVRRGALLLGALLLPLAGCDSDSDRPAPPSLLSAPSIAEVVTGDGIAQVAWTLVPSAESYNLYWSATANVDPQTALSAKALTDLRYTVTGLVNGDTYYFAASANYASGESDLSTEVSKTLAPGMVESVTVSPGDAEVNLTWSDVHGATDYALYRDIAPGVTKLNGQRFGPVDPPYQDAGLVNGTRYFYVVTAIGPGGEGPESAEVSAMPQAPIPDAPQNPSVTLEEEAPNTLVIAWDPPVSGPADSYNLYWDTAPGVTVGTNPILDVTSPYVHSGLIGRTTYYYVVTAVVRGVESGPSLEVSGTPKGGQGGGETEGYGNNLAFPVVFGDGYGLGGLPLDGTVSPWLDYNTGLRPTTTDVVDPFPYFDPATIVSLNGVDYFPQKTTSTWQAAWRDGSQQPVSVVVDWGDNLSSATLTAKSVIRVETVLYQDTSVTNPTETMTAYDMTLLGGSGITELYGTDTGTYESNVWNVFAVTPRLTIEKLDGPGGSVDPTVPGFDMAVYESFGATEGSGYAAEINVSGKLVFGYVWMLKSWPLTAEQKVGWWRLTFSLDEKAVFGSPEVTVQNNVFMTALDPSETKATLDVQQNSTTIELDLR